GPEWAPLSKKPLGPTDEETSRNPRARSAKLRVARWVGIGAGEP
ncbi:MAG: 16S rRNA (cytosine(1402)-N(4))-methyltransferase, partial [Polyangiaceae bacterium]|nr:16S rRNA (cytosine(1402)-N(4))-methyltransferase [Polyangiaceae bacterium]